MFDQPTVFETIELTKRYLKIQLMNKSTETLDSPKKTIGKTNPIHEKVKDDKNPYVK